jgi:hypothetical protein
MVRAHRTVQFIPGEWRCLRMKVLRMKAAPEFDVEVGGQ